MKTLGEFRQVFDYKVSPFRFFTERIMAKNLSEVVVDLIKNRDLPKDGGSFLQGFLSADRKRFDAEESMYWDYKQEFPFSLKDTDEYFCAIVRLVAAFNNTYGGLIIFGVHDKQRTYGHNKVVINIERFNSRLREVFGSPIECAYRRYEPSIQDGAKSESVDGDLVKEVDVILVPKRRAGTLARPQTSHKTGAANQIWIRRGPEVVRADSADFTWLYGPRSDYGLEQEISSERIPASLPPSPSTIKKFIGRSEVLDLLFQWLLVDDNEPRVFLYGSGGSGKSTIAYEFARLVELHGQALTPLDSVPISQVLFFSAKERRLDPLQGNVVSHPSDFSNRRELYEWIIRLGEGVEEDLSRFNDAELERRISKLFDAQRLLIVIDDIDTLLTKGEAAGIDALYKCAIRGRAGTKLLYTQRSLPSLSKENAIEVPRLQNDGGVDSEYYKFVEACCRQFKIAFPSTDFIDGPLSAASDRRPLIVETILALKRTCASYDDALRLFKHDAGDDARAYLFGREYDRLDADNKARYLLAALCLMPGSASFDDLMVALKFEDSQLRDALSQVRDMFLAPTQDQDITSFSLAEIAREFIDRRSRSLDRYAFLKERVSNLLKSRLSEPPELKRIRLRVRDSFQKRDPDTAWQLVNEAGIPENIRQHPHFIALRGEAAALSNPPKFLEARDAFKDCVGFKYISAHYLRIWYTMESRSGFGLDQAIEVCNVALSDKRFDVVTRNEFRSRLAAAQYRKAREIETVNPTDAVPLYESAATNHIIAYSKLFYTNADITRNEEYVCNTLLSLSNLQVLMRNPCGLIGFLVELPKKIAPEESEEIILDATVKPIMESLRRLLGMAETRGSIGRTRGFLNRLENMFSQSASVKFHDPDRKSDLLAHLASTREALDRLSSDSAPAKPRTLRGR